MKCLFYDKTLLKKIPCILVPNRLYTKDGDRFCKIIYDETLFNEYNTNLNELNRYSTDNVDIFDIYPSNDANEIAYANVCIPNNITVNHKNDELIRFEKIITMLINVESIKTDFFYKLADFLSYDLLFFYLNQSERVVMLTICTYPIPLENIQMLMVEGEIPVKPYLRSIKRIFDKYPEDNTVKYYVHNIRNLAEFSYLTFPLELNIPYLKSNINMLYDNGYLT